MTPKQFIEKAIKGGMKPESDFLEYATVHGGDIIYSGKHCIFLRPTAWQAVGKVEGWSEEYNCPLCGLEYYEVKRPGYIAKMHRMIDALCSGKSIEEFLETL